jgi:AcrR family transcriptional regulator
MVKECRARGGTPVTDRDTRNTVRADRILDAAGALLLRLGYRKVTVDDIARQADVGKGTVYLHWRTKEQLFEALVLRETIDLVEELLDHVRADPAEIVPHRYFRASYLATVRRPLLVAVLAQDTEVLGRLAHSSLRGQQTLASDRYFAIMLRRGLLRDDVPHLSYAIDAASTGFFLYNPAIFGLSLDHEARADALAHTIRHAFEPTTPPTPDALSAAAAEVATLATDMIATYRTHIYAHEPARRSPAERREVQV